MGIGAGQLISRNTRYTNITNIDKYCESIASGRPAYKEVTVYRRKIACRKK